MIKDNDSFNPLYIFKWLAGDDTPENEKEEYYKNLEDNSKLDLYTSMLSSYLLDCNSLDFPKGLELVSSLKDVMVRLNIKIVHLSIEYDLIIDDNLNPQIVEVKN